MPSVGVVIPARQVYRSDAKSRSDIRNIAKCAGAFNETVTFDKSRKVGIIAVVEHGIIVALPVELDDVLHIGADTRPGKLNRSLPTGFLVLSEKYVAVQFFYQFHYNEHAAAVITANAKSKKYKTTNTDTTDSAPNTKGTGNSGSPTGRLLPRQLAISPLSRWAFCPPCTGISNQVEFAGTNATACIMLRGSKADQASKPSNIAAAKIMGFEQYAW